MREQNIKKLFKDYGYFYDDSAQIKFEFLKDTENNNYVYESMQFKIDQRTKFGFYNILNCRLFSMIGNPEILILSNLYINPFDYRIISELSKYLFEYIIELAEELEYCELMVFTNYDDLDLSMFDITDKFMSNKTLDNTYIGIKKLKQKDHVYEDLI